MGAEEALKTLEGEVMKISAEVMAQHQEPKVWVGAEEVLKALKEEEAMKIFAELKAQHQEPKVWVGVEEVLKALEEEEVMMIFAEVMEMSLAEVFVQVELVYEEELLKEVVMVTLLLVVAVSLR